MEKIFPVVKEICLNKCPAIAPLGVLEKADGWAKIDLSPETVEKNLQTLLKYPEFAEKMRSEYEMDREFPAAEEPEAAIYDGFLDEVDRIKVAAVRNASVNQLADFHPDFQDDRLDELLLHYKGRNFPETLSENEMQKWEEYRRSRIKKQAPGFLKELQILYQKNDFLAEELKLYFESLL